MRADAFRSARSINSYRTIISRGIATKSLPAGVSNAKSNVEGIRLLSSASFRLIESRSAEASIWYSRDSSLYSMLNSVHFGTGLFVIRF